MTSHRVPLIDDDVIAREIVRQCLARGASKSVCPSEVARALADDESAWRSLMADVRRVAETLRLEETIAVTQRGKPVDVHSTKGPIRFSLCVGGQALKRALRDLGRR